MGRACENSLSSTLDPTNDVSYEHSPWDPLQVAECGSCGRILSVGGHDW